MPLTQGELEIKLPPDLRPRLAALEAWRVSLDSTAQRYARAVQQAVAPVLGARTQLDEAWRFLCREALAGRGAEMQILREQFLRALTDQVLLLREARDLVRFAAQVTQRDLPEVAQLEEQADALQSKLNKLSARWQTAEDLEDLAAECLAPSAEKLEAVRRKYGYPQAWYDDDSKPF